MTETAPLVQEPLASASDIFYHSQYKQVLERLRRAPVMVLTSLESGVGKSHMLRQAAEQLVLGQQLVYVPSAYVGYGLHPSVEYAWRNGGMVVVTDTNSYNLEMSLCFAGQVLSGNNCLGLDHPQRPERNPGFRYIVEVNPPSYSSLLQNMRNPALSALTYDVQACQLLYANLASRIFPTKSTLKAFMELVQALPVSERNSLYLLDLLTTNLVRPVERADCLHYLLKKETAILTINQENALRLIGNEKATTKRASTVKEPPSSEQDSPQKQADALRQVVQEFEHPVPTVQPEPDPVAKLVPNATRPDSDEDLGF